jgi:hypothetical protein
VTKVAAESGEYGVGEATSQVSGTWARRRPHIEACVALYDKALRGQDPRNFAYVHHLSGLRLLTHQATFPSP